MNVRVEQHHIDKGHPLASCRCPISLAALDALARTYPYGTCNVIYVSTMPGTEHIIISIRFRDYTQKHLKPRDWLEGRHARAFMIDFDSRLPVLPFSFDVDFV